MPSGGIDFIKIAEYIKHSRPSREDWEWIMFKVICLWSHHYTLFRTLTNVTVAMTPRKARKTLIRMHELGNYPKRQIQINEPEKVESLQKQINRITGFSMDSAEAAKALMMGYRAHKCLRRNAYSRVYEDIVRPAPFLKEYAYKMLLDGLSVTLLSDLYYGFVELKSSPLVDSFHEKQYHMIKEDMDKQGLEYDAIKKTRIPQLILPMCLLLYRFPVC
jgi:hypothetical protein